MKRLNSVMMVLVCAVAFGGEALYIGRNRLENPGFEAFKDNRPSGWKCYGTGWSVATDGGRHGAGLVWQSDEPSAEPSVCWQEVPAPAGKTHRVCAWRGAPIHAAGAWNFVLSAEEVNRR